MGEQNESIVNWFMVIVDLCRQGYTHAAIGAAVDAPKSTVQGWKQGSEPRHSNGEKLIELWCQATVMDRAQLPTINRYDWRQ